MSLIWLLGPQSASCSKIVCVTFSLPNLAFKNWENNLPTVAKKKSTYFLFRKYIKTMHRNSVLSLISTCALYHSVISLSATTRRDRRNIPSRRGLSGRKWSRSWIIDTSTAWALFLRALPPPHRRLVGREGWHKFKLNLFELCRSVYGILMRTHILQGKFYQFINR